MFHCCSKLICSGCQYTTYSIALSDLAARTTARGMHLDFEGEEVSRLKSKVGICPFCRVPPNKNESEKKLRIAERAAVNDPAAISLLGETHSCEGDYENAC